MSKFYVSRNQQKFGPYTSEQLRQLAASGQITQDEMVSQEGGSQWVAASCIRGLFSTVQVLPASPIPPAAASPSSASDADADAPWLSGSSSAPGAHSYKSNLSRKRKTQMPTRNLDPNNLPDDADWIGNNAAFPCPHCGKTFIVSNMPGPLPDHDAQGVRRCPRCRKSRARVTGGAREHPATNASIES